MQGQSGSGPGEELLHVQSQAVIEPEEEHNQVQGQGEPGAEVQQQPFLCEDDHIADSEEIVRVLSDDEENEPSNQRWGILRLLTTILSLIKSGFEKICTLLGENNRLLHHIATKNETKANPVADLGSYASLDKNGILQFDQEQIASDLRRCNSILRLISMFPYLGLSEDETRLECSFCPGVSVPNYKSSIEDVEIHKDSVQQRQ